VKEDLNRRQFVEVEIIGPDGKMREIWWPNTEGIFRIIQSIPSPKAEHLNVAGKGGYERVQEIEDPELATKRTRMLYKLKVTRWLDLPRWIMKLSNGGEILDI